MRKVIFTLLMLAAVTFMILASCEWEEESADPTATNAPRRTAAVASNAPAATAAKGVSPSPNRTSSPRPSLAVTQAPSLAATSAYVTAASLSRFRVGITTGYSLSLDPNLWEAAGIATPTGLAYSLTYKKLPGCQLLDEAGRDAPSGWSHTNTNRALGGRTYILENWADPSSGKTAMIVFVLDPRIRIQLSVPMGSSECVQAAETVIAASTPNLLGP